MRGASPCDSAESPVRKKCTHCRTPLNNRTRTLHHHKRVPTHSHSFPLFPPLIPIHSNSFPVIPIHSHSFPFIPTLSHSFPFIPSSVTQHARHAHAQVTRETHHIVLSRLRCFAWAAVLLFLLCLDGQHLCVGIMCSLRFRSDSGLSGKGSVGPRGVFSTVLLQYLHTVFAWWPMHPSLFFCSLLGSTTDTCTIVGLRALEMPRFFST